MVSCHWILFLRSIGSDSFETVLSLSLLSFDYCIPLAGTLLEVMWELEVDPKMG